MTKLDGDRRCRTIFLPKQSFTNTFGALLVKEVGLPTALVVELLRGVVMETVLALERMAHQQTRAELQGKAEKEADNKERNGKE